MSLKGTDPFINNYSKNQRTSSSSYDFNTWVLFNNKSFPFYGIAEYFYAINYFIKVLFLTHTKVSQETRKVVWFFYLFQNSPQFVVIQTIKAFCIVNEADFFFFFFWHSLVFPMIQRMLAIWSLVPLPFLNPVLKSGDFWFMYCWSLAWRILTKILLAYEMRTIVW